MESDLEKITLQDLLENSKDKGQQRTVEDRQWLDAEPVGKEFLSKPVSDAEPQP